MSDRIPVKNIPSDVKIHRPSSKKPSDKTPRDRIYVRAVKGLHQKIRQRMNVIFMAAFMLIPWVQYDGHQAVLFDLINQKFTIFSVTLWPQDLTLLAGLFMISAFALFAVTVAYGRVWCGYLCPQTVWTLIFIWFEEKFEGTMFHKASAKSVSITPGQIALARMPLRPISTASERTSPSNASLEMP